MLRRRKGRKTIFSFHKLFVTITAAVTADKWVKSISKLQYLTSCYCLLVRFCKAALHIFLDLPCSHVLFSHVLYDSSTSSQTVSWLNLTNCLVSNSLTDSLKISYLQLCASKIINIEFNKSMTQNTWTGIRLEGYTATITKCASNHSHNNLLLLLELWVETSEYKCCLITMMFKCKSPTLWIKWE